MNIIDNQYQKYKYDYTLLKKIVNKNDDMIGGLKKSNKSNKSNKSDKSDKSDKLRKSTNEKNINKFIKSIEENTKSSNRALYDDQGKIDRIIANYGLQVGEIAIRTSGEYSGFSIKALEEIKPILTDYRIIKVIRHLESDNIQKAIGVLRLTDEVYKYGIDIIYAVLKRWLENNDINIPIFIPKKQLK